MRFTVVFFFLLFALTSLGQLSISVGANRKLEDVSEGRFFKASENRFVHDSYFFGVDWLFAAKREAQWRVTGELSYFEKSFSTGKFRWNSNLYPDTMQGWESRSFYVNQYADHNYSFFGVKIGGYVVLQRGWFSNNVGAFVQMDFLLNEDESNHFTLVKTTTSWENGDLTSDIVSNSDIFDDRDIKKQTACFGINYRPRATFSEFFVELNLALGINFFQTRLELNDVSYPDEGTFSQPTEDLETSEVTYYVDGYNHSSGLLGLDFTAFFESGIKVGYYINWKKKDQEKEALGVVNLPSSIF
jgi:hypothetical protein